MTSTLCDSADSDHDVATQHEVDTCQPQGETPQKDVTGQQSVGIDTGTVPQAAKATEPEGSAALSDKKDDVTNQTTKRSSGSYLFWVFFFLLLVFLMGFISLINSDYWAWNSIKDFTNPLAFSNYLKKHPNGSHRAEAMLRMTELLSDRVEELSKPPFDSTALKNFVTDYPEYDISNIERLFFEDAMSRRDPAYLKSFLDVFPRGEYADRIYRDFSLVSQIDTKEAYQRFSELCPNSPKCAVARKRIIDLEVTEIYRGQHGSLPPSNPKPFSESGSWGTSATIEISNGTQHTIVVRYSGPDSQKIELTPYQKKTITLRTGEYRVTVSTNEDNIPPFCGTKKFEAGRYTEKFYIKRGYGGRRRR